ncbi:hypothetical protein [Domibacillus indicus]|uniref:hypothetical protein n=1 Tax=Domibacillus indicus TaxID=1437523 RepID=UPI0012E09843|nr:hypothetical protein [Domibacillus indicus]
MQIDQVILCTASKKTQKNGAQPGQQNGGGHGAGRAIGLAVIRLNQHKKRLAALPSV